MIRKLKKKINSWSKNQRIRTDLFCCAIVSFVIYVLVSLRGLRIAAAVSLCVALVFVALFLWMCRLSSRSFVAALSKTLAAAVAKHKIKKRDKRISEDSLNGSLIRVCFLVELPSLWTSFESLYFDLCNDPRFSPVVIALPDIQGGEIKNYDSTEYLDRIGVPYIQGYRDKSFIRIKSDDYHYIFAPRPYDQYRPKNMSNRCLETKAKLCYIPYATCMAAGPTLRTVCGFGHLQYFSFVFAENEEFKGIFQYLQRLQPGAENVIVVPTGSPKFDAIFFDDFSNDHECPQQTILYLPRWRTTEGTCSFLDFKDRFFELVETNPDVHYIMRPHPLMESWFSNNEMSGGQWDEYISQFDCYDNAELDTNPDYRESFRKADVLVSDASSLLAEFLLTDKPTIFVEVRPMFNSYALQLAEGMYVCPNWESVDGVLTTLRLGSDPKKPKREKVIHDCFMFDGCTSAQHIKQCLLDDFFNSSVDDTFGN